MSGIIDSELLFKVASQELDDGRHDLALKHFEEGANLDHADSQNSVAVMYETGRGTPRNVTKAICWYERSASLGSATAASNLADLYRKEQREIQAMDWYRKAIEMGDNDSFVELAELLLGQQQPNKQEAVSLLRRALTATDLLPVTRERAISLLSRAATSS